MALYLKDAINLKASEIGIENLNSGAYFGCVIVCVKVQSNSLLRKSM